LSGTVILCKHLRPKNPLLVVTDDRRGIQLQHLLRREEWLVPPVEQLKAAVLDWLVAD
jgi:hypothetical protein